MLEPTPGITEPMLSPDPLMTEGEATAGPDDQNPFDDPGTDGRAAPQLFDGDGPPIDAGGTVDEITDEVGERHGRAMTVFDAPDGQMGVFEPGVDDSAADIFRW